MPIYVRRSLTSPVSVQRRLFISLLYRVRVSSGVARPPSARQSEVVYVPSKKISICNQIKKVTYDTVIRGDLWWNSDRQLEFGCATQIVTRLIKNTHKYSLRNQCFHLFSRLLCGGFKQQSNGYLAGRADCVRP